MRILYQKLKPGLVTYERVMSWRWLLLLLKLVSPAESLVYIYLSNPENSSSVDTDLC